MFTKSNGNSTAEAPSRKSASAATSARVTSVPTLISQDLSIVGDLKTDGEIHIDGRLDGNLTAGKVTIGEQGAVNGSIVCTTIVIRGKVTGKVDASSIELTETSNVQGDLIQDQLIVANGAFLDGKCNRKSAAPTPIKAAPTSKTAPKPA
ncbi:MAG: polymer-forming cytoskeletal protein [Litorimonas sp.]